MSRTHSFLALAVFLSAAPTWAETAPFRLQVASDAAADGLSELTFQLFERQPGAGRDARLNEVLALFDGAPGAVQTGSYDDIVIGENFAMATAENWLLDVRGEGDWVRFWNLKYAEGPDNTPLALTQKPSLQALDAIARPFISTHLRTLVRLGAGDAIEPWYTSHQISIVETVDGKRETFIYASKIVYARTIDGVPVLGPGSKVIVHIAADGTPTGFDVDWSDFVVASLQQTAVSLETVRTRAGLLAAARTGGVAVVEDRLECGYYDTGARRANRAAPMQIGCLSSYRTVDYGKGFLDAIPAAEVVLQDALWPEVALIAP
jgi:hypothetical protein